MILLLTLEVTEWILQQFLQCETTPAGEKKSSMLVANGLAVWGVSLDVGDGYPIPWSKPGRMKI